MNPKPLAVYLTNQPLNPNYSAAGWRSHQVMEAVEQLGYQVEVWSTAAEESRFLNSKRRCKNIVLNDALADEQIKNTKAQIVVFDRFYTEEQFGWRFARFAPQCMRILDMQDVHFLREERRQDLTGSPIDDSIRWRELAAMHRCDLSLVISEVELHLLQNEFEFKASQLLYFPLLMAEESLPKSKFSERNGIAFVGNFKHKPNRDAIDYFMKAIFPKVLSQIPDLKCYIYGAFAPNFKIKNTTTTAFVADIATTIAQHRLCVAPLRFGAGLKGKVFTSAQSGTPCLCSPIAAEGIFTPTEIPELYCVSDTNFVEQLLHLYRDKAHWLKTQEKFSSWMKEKFNREQHEGYFQQRIKERLSSLWEDRNKNHIGNMLLHHRVQSVYYLAKWIEEKKHRLQLPSDGDASDA
ncbi:MAG: glycosyltransferase family 4 protein [Flavobacteriaceae bacterium]|nr:glycosyltransferase family 4 protein [Flavobacteriaceae bacterium]